MAQAANTVLEDMEEETATATTTLHNMAEDAVASQISTPNLDISSS
jgi:hypothetical protein